MANLKELRNQINGIQSIRKVTSAMKLVAGVKLRKAEQMAESSRDYASELKRMLSEVRRDRLDSVYELLDGRDFVAHETLVVFASDRGFCGNFNYLIYKTVVDYIKKAKASGRCISIVCIGNKLFNILKHRIDPDIKKEIVHEFYSVSNLFANAKNLAQRVIQDFSEHRTDKVSLIYTRYYSAMRKTVQVEDLIPMQPTESKDKTLMIFEPNVSEVLEKLLPYNLSIQLYQAALESTASEQSSRMTSMDNATRNADDMLSGLTVKYNRMRQYGITQELVEIVSGAEAISNG